MIADPELGPHSEPPAFSCALAVSPARAVTLRVRSASSPLPGPHTVVHVLPSGDEQMHLHYWSEGCTSAGAEPCFVTRHEDATGSLLVMRLAPCLTEAQRDAPPGKVALLVPSQLSRLSVENERGGVRVAADCSDNLAVFTASGDLHLSGASGLIIASTGAGAAQLDDLDGCITVSLGRGDAVAKACRGELRLASGAGKVNVTEFYGDLLSISVEHGMVSVGDGEFGTLSIRLSDGPVHLSGVSCAKTIVNLHRGEVQFAGALRPGRHQFSVGKGNVHLALRKEQDIRFDLATGSGEIVCPLPAVAVGRQGRPGARSRRLVGASGDATAEVEVRVRQGDISLAIG